MRRERWTLMQWDALKCLFIPRTPKQPLLPLFARQRIPQIDKIIQKPVDPRPAIFYKQLDVSISRSKELLDEWSDDLNVETLEQYALALAMKGAGMETIPPLVRDKLDRFGLIDEISKQLNGPSAGIPLDQNTSPLALLVKHPDADPIALQQTLEQPIFMNACIQELCLRWTSELQHNVTDYIPGSEYEILEKFLPVRDQCAIVASELAHFTTSSVLAQFPMSLSSLCRKLGGCIEHELLLKIANHFAPENQHQMLYVHHRSEYLWGLTQTAPWTVKHRMALGAFWIQASLKFCRFTQKYRSQELSRPAFWKTWYMAGPTKRGVFVVNGYLLKKLRLETMLDGKLNTSMFVTADQIPQLVAPRPWTSTHTTHVPKGMRNLSLIASSSTEGQATVHEAIRSEAALPQLQGLNRLQAQSWRVNQTLLDIMKTMNIEDFDDNDNNKTRSGIVSTISKNDKDFRSEKGKKTQWTQAMAIAESLGSRRFYLPMYMDFRGRCYPSTKSILSFMGNEIMRALFLFGDSKPLGSQGLFWLEIHLANIYGQCKSHTFDSRRHWVSEHRKDVLESVERPSRCDWWKRGAKPFQTLAACIELKKAWESPDLESHRCSLPVQLDGTSNGLQHLVALARDDQNAPFVNVTPDLHGQCGDVYSTIGQKISPELDRNTIKKAVMTFFYGASPARIAALLSSTSRCDTSDLDTKTLETTTTSTVTNGQVSTKLSNHLAQELTSMFSAERDIQNWLVDCARRICSARRADQQFPGAALTWTTPLGLPVVQPYVEPKLMAVRTPLQSFFLPSPFHLSPVISAKQAAGIVANFIHSLDATHMLATARKMPSEHSFAAVHDSFWTHPGSVPVLNRVLRNEFIRLHQTNILDELRQEWLERYKDLAVVCMVHSDSPYYNKIIWERNGVAEGRKQLAYLDTELREIYEQRRNHKLDLPETAKIHWEASVPHLGTIGLPHVKAWIPLELAPPPAKGNLDITKVHESPYFFS